MNLVKIFAFVCSLGLLLSACNSSSVEEDTTGSLSVNLKQNNSTVTIGGVKTAVPVADYAVKIEDDEGNVVQSFDHFSQITSAIELMAGNYTVIAESMELQAAAFDAPYMMGNQDITIQSGESQTVDLNCRMENVKVSLIYSDEVRANYDSYSTEITNGEGSLTFDMNENRAAYFSAISPLTLTISLSKDGETTTKTEQIEVAANEYHTINIAFSSEAENQTESKIAIQTSKI